MNDYILLTEANYKDKYPPLGLMKISTYHKLNGDYVTYSRELLRHNKNYFAKIYITTRFSFHWRKTKELIHFYQTNYDAEILIGGIHASINPDLYEKEFGIKPNIGSLRGNIMPIFEKIKEDKFLSLYIEDINRYGIDVLPPDYSIFYNQELPFNKILKGNYLLRATKGCKRNCSFCDVKKICEGYIEKLPILPLIKYIDQNFGIKDNILFFDDNTLQSRKVDAIVFDLKEAGFTKRVEGSRKMRSCDFNQGLDLRLLDNRIIDLLNTINIKPIRFAFDDISMKDVFIDRIMSVIERGIKNISVYVLYNYKDTPQDFYERLRISVRLNSEYKCRIMSFPMKYIPNDQTDRKYVGINWKRRMIRGVQCIINGCHGIVPVDYEYFQKAFGKDTNEFLQIIQMPEKYIVNRNKRKQDIMQWKNDLQNMEEKVRMEVLNLLSNQTIYSFPSINLTKESEIRFLNHYVNEKY